jgi:hypothetical protein
MRIELLPLSPASYAPHALHGGDADWAETNCATDMWIEILHAWGHDPVAGLAFTVATDFDGEQWAMFTYPEEDLRLLYGIEVRELNIWCPLVEHLCDHLRLGHLVAVDVDAYFLPDTAGVTYRTTHQKTTVAVQMIDLAERRLGYFHNAGYAELGGDDFDGILHVGSYADPLYDALPPFAMLIRPAPGTTAGTRRVAGAAASAEEVLGRMRVHLDRRPTDNPVRRMAKRVAEDLPSLPARGMDFFHRYAFGTFRHLGANGELAAAFVDWVARSDGGERRALEEAARSFRAVSSGAKTAEFVLARAAAGRRVDLAQAMAPLEEAWESGVSALAEEFGRCAHV